MIKLPNDLQEEYDAKIVLYKLQIEELKQKSINAKEILLSEHFDPYPNDGNLDDKINFVQQFVDFILDLVLFPDDEVLTKLRDLKFAKHSLRWFIKLEDITMELDRLSNLDGLYILPNSSLFAIRSHINTKFLITMMEDFGLFTKYNNADSNILFKDFAERYRRREYNEKKKQTPKMDWYEKYMNKKLDSIEKVADNDKVMAKHAVLQPMKGNTSFYYSILDMFHCDGMSQNQAYLEFFPLLQLIIKDKELLSLEEFEIKNNDKDYQMKYSAYQISRVKKILQKK